MCLILLREYAEGISVLCSVFYVDPDLINSRRCARDPFTHAIERAKFYKSLVTLIDRIMQQNYEQQ